MQSKIKAEKPYNSCILFPSLKTSGSTDSSTASSSDSSTHSVIECYLATRSGGLSLYDLHINKTEILIVTQKTNKVKSSIRLTEIHIKEAQKQPRIVSACEDSNADAQSAANLWWYPLKMVLPQSKSRSVFFESRSQRRKALSTILEAQGFENQLEQYEIR